VLNRLKLEFGASDDHISEWYRHWIRVGFAALEHQAAERSDTPFVFGDAPGLADIMLVPQMANARRFNVDLSAFPRLSAWDERARAHPAFAKAAPENQKDAVK
ncbi:MAG: glutathione S-transferase C-terminal domain-containing protein, partial [Vitreimonas sp.]